MSAAVGRSKFLAREQLQQWGVFTLMALLLIGIVLFIFLVLLRDLRRRTEYNALLASAQTELRMAQRVRAETPAKLQNQLVEAQGQLDMAAQAFLNEAESTIVVNRLYTYAEAAGVEIINLQAAPALVAPTHSQRDYHFQVAGQIEALMTFLGSIEEVQLPGFVIGNVAILPNPSSPSSLGDSSPEGENRHLLTMDVSALSSPYSTRTVLGPEQNPAIFANVGDLPLAEVQRQVEVAWVNRDWKEAVNLLEQVVATAPENEAARIALYRAHMNDGYRYLTERNYAAAQAEFETALTLHPDGREATSELQQLAADNTLSHRVEDQLRQALAQAKASEKWQEAIRLLRIIAAVDPTYGPVNEELNQAYINYGNQLARAGENALAQEQYQLAQYTPPGQPPTNQQPPAGGEVAVAAAQPITVAEVIPVALAPEATPTLPPTPSPMPTVAPTHTPTQPPAPTQTATPLPPTPSPVPTNTPMPTATHTPLPTATFTQQPPAATSTATQAPAAVSLPTTTSVNSAAPTPAATATVATSAATAMQPTATYVVRQGDTLFSIAQRFGTTVAALQATNGLTSNTIVVGQLLVITSSAPQPASAAYVEHTVGPNDTLYSLAQFYGTSIETIMQTNGLSSSNIYVGQRLLIPAPVSSLSAVAPAG